MDKIERALQRTRDTKACIIKDNASSCASEVFCELFGGCTATIVADVNTWEAAGRAIQSSFAKAGIEMEQPFIFTDKDLYAEWTYVGMLMDRLSSSKSIAVAVGSGVINDLTKYVSGQLGRKYMCVCTACSMDGYTAYGASITKDGNKQTFDCPAPLGVVVDTSVAAAAPKQLSASGYADLIAKVPAAADWMIADALGSEGIDDFALSLVQDGLKESLSDPVAISRGDLGKTSGLAEGLIMSGFAMQAIRSSRPASGTEHQFSHFWDMEGLCYPDGRHVSHGFKVSIGTIVSTLELEFLLSKDVMGVDTDAVVEKWMDWDEMESRIRTMCADKPAHLARCLEESRAKYVGREELRMQVEVLKKNWAVLSERIRKQIIPSARLVECLKAVGAPYEPEMICVSRRHLMETLDFIPYMRSRVTNIDILFRLGWLEEFKHTLFDKGCRWEIN